jgi:hypothetical protein
MDISPGRAYSTTYYNTTGRPIQVSVNFGGGGSYSFSFSINGVVIANLGTNGGANITHVIPPGASYGNATASGGALLNWYELR